MSIRTKCSLFRALLTGLVLLLATIVLVGCPSAEDKQAEDMLGTNVELSGVWESQSISYTFNGKSYRGIIQLRFTDKQLQIKAPHGISKVHSYTRNGISITIEDPYSSFPIPFTYALEFSNGTFTTTLDNLEFMKGISQKLTFSKIQDSVSFLEPTDVGDEENGGNTNKPDVGTIYNDVEENLVYEVDENGTLFVKRAIDSELKNWNCVIPKEYEGIKVTSIGDEAFYCCSSLTSITIPASVTSIGDEAFFDCSSLTSVTIPDSVTSIGSYAFSGCSSLISITIPDSVTSIGEGAFSDCSSLISITIPDSVTSIGESAFYGCSSLTSVTIPDSVTSIGDYALSGSGLTEIHAESISKDKWRTLVNKSNVKVPSQATVYLDDDQIDGNIVENGISYYLNYETGERYVGNAEESIINVVIKDAINGEAVASIADGVFKKCSSLTSVTIPASVTFIGDYAFSDCINLTSITIPDSVTSIGGRAFYGCSSLISITIPDSVTSIGGYAFSDCINLTSITISDSVTSIGSSAFVHCYRLTKICIDKPKGSISGTPWGAPQGSSIIKWQGEF